MKHIHLLVVGLLAPLSLMAAVPSFDCWLDYDVVGDISTLKNGKPFEIGAGKMKGEESNRGYGIEAELVKGGAALEWYELTLTIKHKDQQAFRTDIHSATAHHVITLMNGNERAVAHCLIKDKKSK